MTDPDDVIGAWLDRTPDAHRARLLDPEFDLLLRRIRVAAAGTGYISPTALDRELSDALPAAVARIEAHDRRTDSLRRRSDMSMVVIDDATGQPVEPGASGVVTVPHAGWYRVHITGRPHL